MFIYKNSFNRRLTSTSDKDYHCGGPVIEYDEEYSIESCNESSDSRDSDGDSYDTENEKQNIAFESQVVFILGYKNKIIFYKN